MGSQLFVLCAEFLATVQVFPRRIAALMPQGAFIIRRTIQTRQALMILRTLATRQVVMIFGTTATRQALMIHRVYPTGLGARIFSLSIC